MSEPFDRIVTFRPAYDKRDPDPSKNDGIHGVELLMLLKGQEGAVQFVLYTNWHLPEVYGVTSDDRYGQRGLDYQRGFEAYRLNAPMPADLGYHSPRPIHDWQDTPTSEECEWVGGGPCYYDGSGLNAWRPFEALLREGEQGVWRELEDYYASVFLGVAA